jgi:hypothetical protein
MEDHDQGVVSLLVEWASVGRVTIGICYFYYLTSLENRTKLLYFKFNTSYN